MVRKANPKKNIAKKYETIEGKGSDKIKDIPKINLLKTDLNIVNAIITLYLRIYDITGGLGEGKEMENTLSYFISDGKKVLKDIISFVWGIYERDIRGGKYENYKNLYEEIHDIFSKRDPKQKYQIGKSQMIAFFMAWYKKEATKEQKEYVLSVSKKVKSLDLSDLEEEAEAKREVEKQFYEELEVKETLEESEENEDLEEESEVKETLEESEENEELEEESEEQVPQTTKSVQKKTKKRSKKHKKRGKVPIEEEELKEEETKQKVRYPRGMKHMPRIDLGGRKPQKIGTEPTELVKYVQQKGELAKKVGVKKSIKEVKSSKRKGTPKKYLSKESHFPSKIDIKGYDKNFVYVWGGEISEYIGDLRKLGGKVMKKSDPLTVSLDISMKGDVECLIFGTLSEKRKTKKILEYEIKGKILDLSYSSRIVADIMAEKYVTSDSIATVLQLRKCDYPEKLKKDNKALKLMRDMHEMKENYYNITNAAMIYLSDYLGFLRKIIERYSGKNYTHEDIQKVISDVNKSVDDQKSIPFKNFSELETLILRFLADTSLFLEKKMITSGDFSKRKIVWDFRFIKLCYALLIPEKILKNYYLFMSGIEDDYNRSNVGPKNFLESKGIMYDIKDILEIFSRYDLSKKLAKLNKDESLRILVACAAGLYYINFLGKDKSNRIFRRAVVYTW